MRSHVIRSFKITALSRTIKDFRIIKEQLKVEIQMPARAKRRRSLANERNLRLLIIHVGFNVNQNIAGKHNDIISSSPIRDRRVG